MLKIYLIISIILLQVNYLSAQVLDHTFNNKGYSYINIDAGALTFPLSLAVQPDDKIIVAGAESGILFLARVNSNGTLDNSFGTEGSVVIPFDASYLNITEPIIQDDGKILVAGAKNLLSDLLFIARFLQNGNLDSSFGNNGIRIFSIAHSNYNFHGQKIIGLKYISGKILIAGDADISKKSELFLSQLNYDGSTDSSFADDGVKLVRFDNAMDWDDRSFGVVFRSDQTLVLAAEIGYYYAKGYGLVALNYDGEIDSSFGNNGYIKSFDSLPFNILKKILLLPDDRFILAGSGTKEHEVAAIRFKKHGLVDSTYGINGIATHVYPGYDFGLMDLSLQKGNKIIFSRQSYHDIQLFRFNSDGSADLAFGDDGIVVSSLNGKTQWPTRVKCQTDGKILVSGFGVSDDTISGIFIARYMENPTAINEPHIKKDAEINIYPNPSNGQYQIKWSNAPLGDKAYLMVLNIEGKVIHRQNLSTNDLKDHTFQIDAPAGIYFLRIETGNEVINIKLVKL